MGKKKLQMKLIEHEHSKQLCFAKRRNGLMKKALELHLVCDVEAVLIAFSPAGRLSFFCGANRRIEDVIRHFAALPEDIRQFHIPDAELWILLDLLNNLSEETKEHIQYDSTISAIQNELSRVNEEILGVLIETRRYEPLHVAIMTIEEANRSEKVLEEKLARVQERKQELTAKNNEDASQQVSYAMNGAESSLPKSLENVQHAKPQYQVNENSDENQHQLPTAYGIQDTLMRQSIPSENLLLEVAIPNSQHAGTSFTSLLNVVDGAEETTSPFRGLFSSQLPDPNHNFSSLQQNQFDISQDALFNSYSYSIGNTTGVNHSSECNEISIDGTPTGNNYPILSLTSPDLQPQPSPDLQPQPSLASFQVPQYQMQLPMPTPHFHQISQQTPLGSSSNMSPFSTPQWSNQGTLQQMPLGSSSNMSPFSTPQWSNQGTLQQNPTPLVQNPTPFVQNQQWSDQITLEQNPTPIGQNANQEPSYDSLFNSFDRMDSMYPDSRVPVFLSRPSHLQMSHPSMGDSNNAPNLSMDLQGPFANNIPQPNFEVGGSSSSAYKRKSPWLDDSYRSLGNYQNGENTALNITDYPAPIHIPDRRPIRNAVYSPTYAHMGLAVDPHIRNLQEVLRNENGREEQQQGNQ